jgi:hypothetical protein
LKSISFLIGHEHGVAIVENYDMKSHFLSFWSLINIWIHYPRQKSSFDYKIDENSSFDIFEMVVNTSEPTKELVNWKLLIFHRISGCKRYQMPFGMVEETWNYIFNY